LYVVRNPPLVLPLTPFLFLLASSALVSLGRRAGTWQTKWLFKLIVAALMCVLFAVPLLQTVKAAIQLTSIDGRETARVWIEQNLPPGAHIALEAYAPYVDPQRYAVQGIQRLIDRTPSWYVENGVEYLVFSEGMYGRFFQEPDRYAAEVSQYAELLRASQLIQEFTDADYEVRVYRVVSK